MVIELYGLTLHDDREDVYADAEISGELKIKTHYECLDIAQSNRVHYLSFSLPSSEIPDLDADLQDLILKHEE